MPLTSQLLRVIALLYHMNADDQAALQEEIMQQRKLVWRSALADRARDFGCNKSPRNPSGGDLNELKAMSTEDAKSIVNTYNRDVDSQLEKLFKANPRGNRNYYRKNMEAWAAKRSAWKSLQISLQTETGTREYAYRRFDEMNLTAPRYLFDGPPPTCDVCVDEFAMGEVDENYVRKHPCPRHIGCPHTWKPKYQKVNCADLWVG